MRVNKKSFTSVSFYASTANAKCFATHATTGATDKNTRAPTESRKSDSNYLRVPAVECSAVQYGG